MKILNKTNPFNRYQLQISFLKLLSAFLICKRIEILSPVVLRIPWGLSGKGNQKVVEYIQPSPHWLYRVFKQPK
jgi:hypothetical protein